MNYNHFVTATINLKALQHNLKVVKEKAPYSKILAMVKSNAYGHGACRVVQSMESQVDAFGVVFLKEAVELYDAGIKKPIVVLTGFFDAEELKIVDDLGLECVVHNFEQIDVLDKTKLTQPLKVWFKIDTGMHRLGFQLDQVDEAYQRLMKIDSVQKPLKLTTHFSDADDVKSGKTAIQIANFEKAIANLEGELCMANSAAIFNWPTSHVHWIRPGLALYGATSFHDKTGLEMDLKPVMTLRSRIISIHELDKGETIGYGSVFSCPEKMRVGTVAIGYGDGYPRNTKTGAPILVDGKRAQLIGRVAMDMLGVDLRNLPHAKIGSEVVLWGEGLPVEEVSAFSGEVPYEMFCRLTQRVYYQYVE